MDGNIIKPEEQYFIQQIEVWITREGRGVVEDRHVTADNHDYYKIFGKETRYVIKHYVQSRQSPAVLYTRPLQEEAYFASSVVRPTRKYRQELDNTFFKYYDDAEEVLNNIIYFILWLKNLPTLPKKATKLIKDRNDYLLRARASSPEMELIRQSQVGLTVKRRDQLGKLARDLAEERDLIQ